MRRTVTLSNATSVNTFLEPVFDTLARVGLRLVVDDAAA